MRAAQWNKRIGWGMMTFFALTIILIASRYFTMNPEAFFPQQRAVYLTHQAAIYTHILGGVLALGLGPFQFLGRLRARRPQVHRWMGRLYLLGILLGGTAGFYMAFYAYAGVAASLGFGTLAVLWLLTGFMAYRTIRMGNTAAHRQWMIRNFSLTYAAVMLRLQMPVLTMLFGETTGYEIVAWACWIPNLLVAEAILLGWFRLPKKRASIRKQPVRQT